MAVCRVLGVGIRCRVCADLGFFGFIGVQGLGFVVRLGL